MEQTRNINENTTTAEESLNAAYLELAQDWSLWEKPLEHAFNRIIEVVSQSLQVDRVGIWLFENNRQNLRKTSPQNPDSDNYAPTISRDDYPGYFSALDEDRIIDAVNARQDRRTRELNQTYLLPLGILSMLDATLRKTGQVTGVLCSESTGTQRNWTEYEKRFAISVADLVSQRLIYEDIRRNELYYRGLSTIHQAIFNGANYSIIATDTGGIIRYMNKAAEHILGYKAAELTGKATPTVFHDPDEIAAYADRLSRELNRTIPAGFEAFVTRAKADITEELEWTYIRKDGKRIPVLLSITALKDEDGKIDGYLGIATDISEKVFIERALREEEARYRMLFEHAGDSILLMKGEFFTDCNTATLTMFGCTREQIIGQTPFRYSPARQPDGRDSEEKALEKISAAFAGETQFFEWQHSRFDGSTFDAEVTLNVIDINGDAHILANVRDVSERKQSENELSESRQALIERNENLKIIYELSGILHSSLNDIDKITEETLNILMGVSHTPDIAIYLVDSNPELLRLVASRGFDENTRSAGAFLSLSNSLSGAALKDGRILFSPDIASDNRLNAEVRQKLVAGNYRSAFSIPLIYSGENLGSINLVYSTRYEFNRAKMEIFDAIGKTVSLALVNAKHMQELQYQAHHDSLTHLPNRVFLHREFGKHLTGDDSPAQVTLMLIDLDRFKEINDTLGHHIGDQLLQQIGPRLRSALDDYRFTLCRLGGDEFTIMIHGKLDDAQIQSCSKSILAALRQPFLIDNMTLEIDASIGISVYPRDGDDSHSLLRSADVAMYEAKRKGYGYAFYDRSLDIHSPERLVMMAELGTAIRSKQLVLHYQPKINLEDNSVCGFEALVRWRHTTMGMLFPDRFMPMAEVGEVIHELTREIIDLALHQQMQWRNEGRDYSIAINLSARNLIDDRCIRVLRELMDTYQTDPEKLELEITETALMQDPEGAVQLLNRIADIGIKLSVDDFGIGYSSLNYLRRLPIYALKIDRAFVKDMLTNEQDEIIVRSTIDLAHNLKLKVIAEGVEDEPTLKALAGMGCDMAQGFYINKPVDSSDI